MKTIRKVLSIYITKIIIILSKRLFNGGTNLPGRIATKLYPDILQDVAKGYTTVFITGTNGKTTTTSLVYNALKNNGYDVITNATGANMYAGIVTTFVKAYKKNIKGRYAIIEVDEANLVHVTKYIKPSQILITNLFRDQLDRYGEVYKTLEIIMNGITYEDTTLILNGDEPLFGDMKVNNPIKYFGLTLDNDNKIETNVEGKYCIKCKSPYSYNFVSYNHLGDYVCNNCGYKRPAIDYIVDEVISMNSSSSVIRIGDNIITLNMSGLYNVYNAISAYSVCIELGLEAEKIVTAFAGQENSFGRQEHLMIEDKEVNIILVKNPAGYNEALNSLLLSDKTASVAFLLNDNYADGRDISWIWDVNFEKSVEHISGDIYVGGIRTYDMAIRLKVAGFNTDKFHIVKDNNELIDKIKDSENNLIYILATYTAMIELRKNLYQNKYISKLW